LGASLEQTFAVFWVIPKDDLIGIFPCETLEHLCGKEKTQKFQENKNANKMV